MKSSFNILNICQILIDFVSAMLLYNSFGFILRLRPTTYVQIIVDISDWLRLEPFADYFNLRASFDVFVGALHLIDIFLKLKRVVMRNLELLIWGAHFAGIV